jgi:hypothetical protein
MSTVSLDAYLTEKYDEAMKMCRYDDAIEIARYRCLFYESKARKWADLHGKAVLANVVQVKEPSHLGDM